MNPIRQGAHRAPSFEFTDEDRARMAQALRLAERGSYSCAPNPRVGCVLVHRGQVVGQGFHRRTGEAHAEAAALGEAGVRARGATAYVTLEPCRHTGRTPPCTRALMDAGVSRVVAAMTDPNPHMSGEGLRELERAGIDTACGLLGDEARALNEGFVSRMTRQRPFVRAKIAMSLDARTAMASGESQWITGPPARMDVQHWRALSGAIITGIGTVMADNPRLNVRTLQPGSGHDDWEPPAGQPLRVVMDSHFRMSPDARILDTGPVLVAGAAGSTPADDRLRTRAEVLPLPGSPPDPDAVLQELARREINDVLVEAGPLLTGAFVAAGLVDELLVYLAPALLGSEARPMMALPGMSSMADQLRLDFLETIPVGGDLRIRARPAASESPSRSAINPPQTGREEG